MRHVMVQFGPDTNERQREAILAAVDSWPGVQTACCLKANSKSAAVRRMGCVSLKQDTDEVEIVEALRNLSGVASAAIERERIPICR